MPSNLNIKYGNKDSIPSLSAGNILAAENNTGNIEMYIDTPKTSGSERKRLDPRIFVGGLSDVNVPGNPSATDAAKTAAIWENYDVWIDTDGDPTGTATNSSDGLMSRTHVSTLTSTANTLSGLINELNKIKLQIVTQSYWNNDSLDEDDEYNFPRNKEDTENLEDWLTIIVPDIDENNPEECLVEIDMDNLNIPTINLAINNSEGFGGGSGS